MGNYGKKHVVGLLLLAMSVLRLPSATAQNAQANFRDYAELSKRLTNAKDYSSAERAIRFALAANAGDEWAWRHLSWLLCRQNRFEEAAQAAKQALSLKETPFGLADLANAAMGQQDYAQVRQVATYALSFSPQILGKTSEHFWNLYNAVRTREFTLIDRVDPKKLRRINGSIAIPVAQDLPPYQTAQVKVRGVKSFQLRKENDMAVLIVEPFADKIFEIVSTIRVTPTSFRSQLAQFSQGTDIPETIAPFLSSTDRIEIEDASIQQLGKSLKGSDDLDSIARIYSWFEQNFRYAGDKPCESPAVILKQRGGHCDAYSRLFTALCRVTGVPARPIRMNHGDWGSRAGQESGYVSYHSIVEVWVRGVGWVPTEPQGRGKFGIWQGTDIRLYPYLEKLRSNWAEHLRPDDKASRYIRKFLD